MGNFSNNVGLLVYKIKRYFVFFPKCERQKLKEKVYQARELPKGAFFPLYFQIFVLTNSIGG
jgi:hypothetical protein